MSEWSLFGLEPTSDKRAIKRAYAKLIKTVDPATEPKRFQEVREAYDYLLNYGRYYVDEEILEQSQRELKSQQETKSQQEQIPEQEQIPQPEQITKHDQVAERTEHNQLDQKESLTSYSEQSNEEESYVERVVIQETAIEQQDPSVDNLNNNRESQPERPSASAADEQEGLNRSEQTQLVYSGIELQSQEIATDFYQKTSYQSAQEFVEKMEKYFKSENPISRSDWISLIEDDEYQYFDVIELLRVDVFGFLVEQIEENLEAGNQPEALKLKLLKERLPQDFDWLVKYFSEHFDWKNTELILSSHFSGDQMKLLGQFYLKHNPVQVVDSTGTGSNTKHYIFWIIFLVVLVKVFSAMDESSVKEPISSERGKAPSLFDSNKSSIFCSHYRLINSDKRALECEQKLLPADSKKRLILSLYWINQFDSDKKAGEPQEILDKSLSKGVELLQQASDNQYNPATNLLAWMKLSKHYQQNDHGAAKLLLEKSQGNRDKAAKIALGIGYYIGMWGEPDPAMANDILQSIDIQDPELSANLKYVLAASSWFGVIQPRAGESHNDTKRQASQVLLDNSETADLQYVNNAAWYFATANNESFDPITALNLARQFQSEYRDSQYWQHHDTLAAAYAARENFEMALESIDRAAELLEKKYERADDSSKLEALEILNQHRAIFQQKRRINETDNLAMQALLKASFTELMRIDLQNLPD